MKNILVPTDFSIASLNIVHDIVNSHSGQPVRIYFIHMLHIPTDIMDLMFIKDYLKQQQIPYAFNSAMQELRRMYRHMAASIIVEYYYGNRAAILHSIIENRRIDAVYLLENYTYTLPLKDSVDLIPLISRSTVPVHRVPLSGKVLVQGEGSLVSSPFFRQEYSTMM